MRVVILVAAALLFGSCSGAESSDLKRDTLVAAGENGSFELEVETPEVVEVGEDQLIYRYVVRNRSSDGGSAALDARLDGLPRGCDLDDGHPWSDVGPYALYPRFNVEVGEEAGGSHLRTVTSDCVGTFEAVFRLTVVERGDTDQVRASDSVLRVPITVEQ